MEHDQQTPAVEEVTLQPQPVASIRGTIPIAQIGPSMGERLEALGAFVQREGLAVVGPPFARYHSFGEAETDLEVGVPVRAPISGKGAVAAGALPGGPAIATWHFGAHDRLGEAYARIHGWLAEHGQAADGPAWEIYHWIDLSQPPGDAPPAEPATWRVQLVQPIVHG